MLGSHKSKNEYPRLTQVLLIAILVFTIWQFVKVYWPAWLALSN